MLGIAKILNISKNTVLSRMIHICKNIKTPYLKKLGCKFEIEKMWNLIENKKNVIWITYVIEQKTKSVIDFLYAEK